MGRRRLPPIPILAGCFALVASACSIGADPREPGVDSGALASSVEPVMAELRDDGFSGVVLVATADDRFVYSFGYADRDGGVAIGPDTVFDIGSLTKQFTGAAILRLEMDGLLSTDDPLSTFLPEIPSEYGAITLHQMAETDPTKVICLGIDDV